MPEDAGKKIAIRNFLKQVNQGLGYIDGIWIDREVKKPGTGGQYTEASSLSGRSISNLTEMLKDDLKHCFDEGFFTFRFIAAVPGSGKTALLCYLVELIEIDPSYSQHSVVVSFTFNDLLSEAGNQSFGVKLYSYILTQTFWNLLKDEANLPDSVKKAAENSLKRVIGNEQFAKVKSDSSFEIGFTDRLNGYWGEKQVNFANLFFSVIKEISEADPLFTFVYLIDELDALHQHIDYVQDARSIVRALINRAFQTYQGKIHLMIYMVGISDDVGKFIREDAALESRVSHSIISLFPGRNDEVEKIKSKITSRIEGAYSGCGDFSQAWNEIQNIMLLPGKDFANLREFCKKYATEVLQIHEKYFRTFDKNFNVYENKARQEVKTECNKHWGDYLKKTGYTLSIEQTTTLLEGHAFDCYVELLHNGTRVARAFGEAKNYELLSGHLETFSQWLKDVDFKPSTSDKVPPDLAFMIAPSCPPLLQRKLELKKIEFIQSDKVIGSTPVETLMAVSVSTPVPTAMLLPTWLATQTTTPTSTASPVNINTASKQQLIKAFQGTRIKKEIIDKIIMLTQQQHKTYRNLEELESESELKFTAKAKEKLEEKINNGEICF